MINIIPTPNVIIDSNEKYIRPKKYFPPPPIIGTYYEYIDVNKDKNLRKSVTQFFHKKVLKWISSYPEFSHLKQYQKKFDTQKGYELIYNMIRKFTKEYNVNWFDLKDYYPTFKDYLKFNLLKYAKEHL